MGDVFVSTTVTVCVKHEIAHFIPKIQYKTQHNRNKNT